MLMPCRCFFFSADFAAIFAITAELLSSLILILMPLFDVS